jgi:hypothetical protein
VKRLGLIAIALLLSGCQLATASWPKPEPLFYHAATPVQEQARIADWRGRGYTTGLVAFTGSMSPWLHGGETVILEPYNGQPLHAGMVLTFWRGAVEPNVIHLCADVGPEAVYMTGIHNRYSDGWILKTHIHSIVREVITSTTEGTR